MKNPENGKFATELTVGEVAARSGVTVPTLHFYESQGLIESWRNEGNQRRFAREVLRRIAVIRVAQRTGISLASIRDTLKTLHTQFPKPPTYLMQPIASAHKRLGC